MQDLRVVLGKRRFMVVEMMAQDALTISEIADRLNVTPSTISTHLCRAKELMQARNSFAVIGLYWQWRTAGDREFESWRKH